MYAKVCLHARDRAKALQVLDLEVLKPVVSPLWLGHGTEQRSEPDRAVRGVMMGAFYPHDDSSISVHDRTLISRRNNRHQLDEHGFEARRRSRRDEQPVV
jgi:hypothetical protein